METTSRAAPSVLLGWSDLGVHETDAADASIYCLLPPYSTLHAQLITNGKLVTATNGITVTFAAVADATGSINTTSQGKGSFFKYAPALYGKPVAADQGPAGFGMPGAGNRPQTMAFDPTQALFTAEGIPLTPYDDQGHTNFFPMMRLVAKDSSGTVLATTDVALPVSDQMDCRRCHASGSLDAARPASGWVWNCNPSQDYKLNILRYHDDVRLGSTNYTTALVQAGYNPAGLVATVLQNATPVLCVRCHASNALPGSGVPGMRPFTRLIHTKHAKVLDPELGVALDDATQSAACLRCHAGPESRYVRGVHHNTIAADGSPAMSCQNCHGTMSDVGARTREGWLNEPGCQSCHTGTAMHNAGQLRYTNVFTAPQTIRVPVNLTFATETNSTSKTLPLFRTARGHGGLFCESCHGPAHGEITSAQANENVQSQNVQGYPGLLMECASCHPGTPSNPWTGGPHGMHAVGEEWIPNHPDAADFFGQPWCAECHGADLTGTGLSLIPTTRTFQQFSLGIFPGFQLGCFACHESSSVPNVAATVSNLTTNTTANRFVKVIIPARDSDGDNLSIRIISQPSSGSAFVQSNTVTYFPAANFIGTDTFTYSAWDGWIDSNLGTAKLNVIAGACTLTAAAIVPSAALPGAAVPFAGSGQLSSCADAIVYDWDFGDGSAHGSAANACHAYASAGTYAWKLAVTAGGQTQRIDGVITVNRMLGDPVLLTISQVNGVLTVSWPADNIGMSLESTSDPTVTGSWQPVIDPISRSASNFVYQTSLVPQPQYFRVRRVP